MYAVIRSGGKQYRVAPGETVKVETLPGEVGAKVTFGEVLAVSNDEQKLVTGKHAVGAKVTGKIVSQDRHAKVILDLPGITVSVPSPHYLLALKVQAARIDRDQDDIRFLARETGAKTADDVLRIAEQVIGRNRLLPKAQFIVQEMFPEDPAEPSPP